jgi:methionyl-tRNA formyltransferase
VNITLLGHPDIASLYALDRVIGLLPEHDYSVLLSGKLQTGSAGASSLAALARADAELCERFLSGAVRGPVAAELSARPVATLGQPNSPQGCQALRDLDPDLIISIRYRRILREEAIAIPGKGVINLHSGILPDYRGVMATFWAMLAGEKEIGTTLHRIVDSGIDTGPILGIYRRAARPERSYLANVLGLYAGGCDMIAAAVDSLVAGHALPAEEQSAEGRYFGTPETNDVQRFEASDLSLFDGSEAAEIRPPIRE